MPKDTKNEIIVYQPDGNGLVLFVARSSPRPRLTRMRGTATPRGKGIRVYCCSNPKALTPSEAYPSRGLLKFARELE